MAGELGSVSVSLSSNIDILICNNNSECADFAKEVRSLAIEDGVIIVPYIVGPDGLDKYQDDTRKFMLCYINENTFEDNNSVHRVLEHALNEDVYLLMV